MSSYNVSLMVTEDKFPEIGNPISPNTTREAKIPRALKDDYTAYYTDAYANRDTLTGMAGINKGINVDLEFSPDMRKTFKFLGMDIDEDYNTVIKSNSGYFIVGNLFDKEKIEKIYGNLIRYRNDLSQTACSSLTRKDIGKIVTALKSGKMLDIYNKSKDEGYRRVSIDSMADMVQFMSDILSSSISTNSDSGTSIILRLIRDQRSKENIKSTSADSSSYVLSAIFNYWSQLLHVYSTNVKLLGEMDLWSDLNSKLLGADEFSRRFSKCCTVTPKTLQTTQNLDVVSFSGISRNGGAYDNAVILQDVESAIDGLCSVLTSGYSDVNADTKSLLVSLINTDGIDDVYSLDANELQAMSIMDSLHYIDEDAELCRDSYDMSDPDQRGMYLKSALRSYERNFKEFKPRDYYDVTEKLADMVDRGTDIKKGVVIASKATDDTEADIITGTQEEIDVSKFVSDLGRAVKLLSKSLEKVLKDF